MATTLTGVASNGFSSFLSLPVDGTDYRTASSLYPAHQRAADNFAYLAANALFKNSGTFTLSAPLTIAGAAVQFSLGVQINGALGLAAGAVVAGGVTVDNIACSGNTQVGGVLTFSSAGHVQHKYIVGANAASTYNIGHGTRINASLTLSAAREYRFNNAAGVGAGAEIEVVNSSAHVLTLKDDATGNTIGTLSSAGNTWTKIIFDGTTWINWADCA